MDKKQTISKMIALHLKSIGVQSIFGVPGGGSSLDLIDAAESVGIKFYLVKREDAAVIMACVYGELTKSVGVALVTKGPGLSNSMNGIAYSSLDRSPLILFSDGFSDKLSSFVTHQVFDQKKLMSPFSKNYSNLQNKNPEIEFKNACTHTEEFKSWIKKAKSGDEDAADKVRRYQWRPKIEVYDLKNDPYEWKNLAGRPGIKSIQSRLGTVLRDWMDSQGDKGQETELAALDRQARAKKRKKSKRTND